MKLYAYNFYSRAERVIWVLEELGYQYDLIRLDPLKGETNTPEFIQLNPSKKIPVLVHEDKVLTESLAIMEYLSDISDKEPLVPLGVNDSYLYHKYIHYGLSEIEPYLWIAEQATTLSHVYQWPEGTYDYSIERARSNLEISWDWFKNKHYLVKEFGIVDIYFQQMIRWAEKHNIKYPDHIADYLKNLESRKSFTKIKKMLKELEK